MMHYDIMFYLVFVYTLYWNELCIVVSCPGVRSRVILLSNHLIGLQEKLCVSKVIALTEIHGF